jgi:RNA methyltransferase, TrmH family
MSCDRSLLPRITSRENGVLKRMRLVASGARRAPDDIVLAEGVRLLEEAVASGSFVEAAVVDEGFGTEPRSAGILEAWMRSRVPVSVVSTKLLQSASGVTSPQGAVALVRVPAARLETVPDLPTPFVVCACGVRDPGNLGSIIRTAVAAGATLFCTTEATVSARGTKTLRATAGAFFRIPIVESLAPAQILDYCRRRKIALFTTSPTASRVYTQADLSQPCAIVLGNEARGLGRDEWGGAAALRIPIAPGAESLNVAAAAAVLLLEASRQRSGETVGNAQVKGAE